MADNKSVDEELKAPRLPPRSFVRLAWAAHGGIYRLAGGRLGLWAPASGRWGTLRLNTVGRRSSRKHSVILGYFDDGQNLVTMAMNGWGKGEPAWWLNLLANPAASVDLKGGGSVAVHARAAEGDERARLWDTWRTYNKDLDAYATLRPSGTAVVILEPRPRGEG